MKKKLLLFMSLLIILFNCLIPSTSVQAATPYMKKLNVKFDLKENTWTTIRRNLAGNVWVKSRVMIKNIKIKNADKKGYKSFTCDIFFEHPKISKKQVKKILHSSYYKKHKKVGGDPYFWITDYYIGDKGLKENKVELGVGTIDGKYYKYKDSDGCFFKFCDYTVKLEIIYPKKYKNICIGVSGNGSYKYHGEDNIKKHPAYKNDKKYMHFMRIK